jgi:hypothetical protein
VSSPDVAPDGSLGESEVPDNLTDREPALDTNQRFSMKSIIVVIILTIVLATGAALAMGTFDPSNILDLIFQ